MPISALDLTNIVDGELIDETDVTLPFGQIESSVNDILAGDQAFEQLNVGSSSEVTIASGVITISLTHHTVDTEGNAASDEVDTILGGNEGDWLWLRLADASRTVTFNHNTGNLYFSGGAALTLDDANALLVLHHNGSKWVNNAAAGNSSGSSSASIPNLQSRITRSAVSYGASLFAMNVSLSQTGTLSASNQTDSAYTNTLTGSSSGNSGGVKMLTSGVGYALCRRQHDPIFFAKMRTVDISVLTLFGGLISADIGSDVASGGASSLHACGFRMATALGETTWQYVTADGSHLTATDSGITVNANTAYDLLCWLDDANSLAWFSINGATAVSVATTLPSASQDLGAELQIITREAVGKNMLMSRISVEHD